MGKYRSRSEIISELLGALVRKREGLKPTRLMYAANLSHTQMKPYMDELRQRGFVKDSFHKKSHVVVITDAGCEYLEAIRRMQEFERGWGL